MILRLWGQLHHNNPKLNAILALCYRQRDRASIEPYFQEICWSQARQRRNRCWILAWVPNVQTRSEGLSASYSVRTVGFSPPIEWAVRGSAAGLYIMPRLRARRAVTCGDGVHRGNFMCTCTTQQWFGGIRRCCEFDCRTQGNKVISVYFHCFV